MTSSSIESKNQYKEIFKELKCCVFIPTYNNATTLKNVITDVIEYTDDIIVFNLSGRRFFLRPIFISSVRLFINLLNRY